MRGMLFCLVGLLLLATGSALAAKVYSINPDSGEIVVTKPVEEPEEEQTPDVEEKPAYCPEDEMEIGRLRELIRRQQQALLNQQVLISRLREELGRKENIIRGLDLLRRQGR